jgi:hypothetical protein
LSVQLPDCEPVHPYQSKSSILTAELVCRGFR